MDPETVLSGLFPALPAGPPPAVVPIVIGPLQALVAILPGLLAALGGWLIEKFKPSALKHTALLLWAQKVQVLIVAAAVAGAIYLWPVVFPRVVAEVGASEAGAWPLHRGSLGRRGAVPDAEIEEPGHGGVRWAWKDYRTIYASPCVAGNRVYVTSVNYGIFGDNGGIHCLDAETGRVVWSFEGSKYRSTYSSPAVAGRYLVVGEGLHLTKRARVFCLDIEASEEAREGVVLWSYTTNSHVESSPCIELAADGKGGRAYIGAGDDGWYCFDLDGAGEKRKAKVLWHLHGDRSADAASAKEEDLYLDAETSPVFHAGKLYFGLGLGGKSICCVDAEREGAAVWRIETPYPAFGSPAFAAGAAGGGRLFVGMGNGDMVFRAEDARPAILEKMRKAGKSKEEIAAARKWLGPAGEVWCIDVAKAGKKRWSFDERAMKKDPEHPVLWRFKAGRTILGVPAYAEAYREEGAPPAPGGEVYFGSRDGHVYCVSAETGALLGKRNLREAIVTSPAVAEKTVYIVTSQGRLVALDRKDLRPVWELPLGARGTGSYFLSSPAVARGRVYVGTAESGLLCVGRPGRLKEPPLWTGRLGGAGGAWADGSPLPAFGRYNWHFPRMEGDRKPPEVRAPAALIDLKLKAEALRSLKETAARAVGKTTVPKSEERDEAPGVDLYVGMEHEGRPGLACVHLGERPKRRPEAALKWFCPTGRPVRSSAAATHERVFVVDGAPGSGGRTLVCVGATSGKRLWDRPVAAGASGRFVLTRERIYIVDAPGKLSCLALTNPSAVIWSAEVGRVVGAPVPTGDLLVVALEDPARLAVLDAPTGGTLWSVPLEGAAAGAPLLAGRVIWVGSTKGLAAYDLVSGRRLARRPGAAVASELVSDGERLACVDAKGALVVLAAASGRFDVYARTSREVSYVGEVTYRIAHEAGTSDVTIDQDETSRTGGWKKLGTYTFAAGTEGYVDLAAGPRGGRLSSGEVRFVPEGASVETAAVEFVALSTQGKWQTNEDGTLASDDPEAMVRWRPDLPPTGLVLARANGAKSEVPPVVCGEAVLYYDGTWLRRLDLASGETKGWMKIETWGALTSPIVVFDSLAVFATDERGLVCARRSRR